MGLSIPKILLGSEVIKKSKFDMSNSVTTTQNFGEVNVTRMFNLIPQAKVKVKMRQLARLSELSVPTFGTARIKNYARFVDLEQVFMPFASFLSKQTYNGANATYIPRELPFISIKGLLQNLQINNFTPLGVFTLYVNDIVDTTPAHYNSFIQNAHLPFSALFDTEDGNYTLVNFKNADFVHKLSLSGTTYYAYFRWNDYGKRLRKLFDGCNYPMDIQDAKHVTLLPLLATYKAYFDQFVPQNTAFGPRQWTNTNCYKLIQYIANYGISDVLQNSTCATLLRGLLADLADMYYYSDPDFIGAHQLTANLGNSTTSIPDTNVTLEEDGESRNYLLEPQIQNNPVDTPFISGQISRISLQMLNAISKRLNKETILGGKVAEKLALLYGAKWEEAHRSYNVGGFESPVSIFDINATATTTNNNGDINTLFGQVTGKGIAEGKGKFAFTAPTYGYLFIFSVIVPDAKRAFTTSQLNYHTTLDNGFYQPLFDSLGYVTTLKNALLGKIERYDVDMKQRDVFGLVPRSLDLKVCDNKLNGDCSLRSMRGTYLPYTLDNIYSPFIQDEQYVSSIQSFTPELRTIGKYPQFGNFNRIFNNLRHEDLQSDPSQWYDFNADNFVIHNIIECDMFAPMKGISESFDTGAEDSKDVDAVTKG